MSMVLDTNKGNYYFPQLKIFCKMGINGQNIHCLQSEFDYYYNESLIYLPCWQSMFTGGSLFRTNINGELFNKLKKHQYKSNNKVPKVHEYVLNACKNKESLRTLYLVRLKDQMARATKTINEMDGIYMRDNQRPIHEAPIETQLLSNKIKQFMQNKYIKTVTSLHNKIKRDINGIQNQREKRKYGNLLLNDQQTYKVLLDLVNNRKNGKEEVINELKSYMQYAHKQG